MKNNWLYLLLSCSFLLIIACNNTSQNTPSSLIPDTQNDSLSTNNSDEDRDAKIRAEKEERERLEKERIAAEEEQRRIAEEEERIQREIEERERKEKEIAQREREITLELASIGSQMRNKMPEIERLYYRYQKAKSNGILSDPYSEFDLNDALDELLRMKRKQIELAKQLDDPQLVREYEQQLKQLQDARDQIFYGDYGRVPSLY